MPNGIVGALPFAAVRLQLFATGCVGVFGKLAEQFSPQSVPTVAGARVLPSLLAGTLAETTAIDIKPPQGGIQPFLAADNSKNPLGVV